MGRFQANDFFETTERLPEVVLDVKRLPLFGGPIFYEGETGIAELHRNFPDGSTIARLRHAADRFLPSVHFSEYFLRLALGGVRGLGSAPPTTMRRAISAKRPSLRIDNPFIPDFLKVDLEQPVAPGGNKLRTVFNGGLESSFKISRTWESAQSTAWGLDGLRHIIQPFTNFSWVSSANSDPAAILQFDRYQASTQLRAIDFPQFTTIDSIDNWTVWRVGVRNRLQTRRDDATVQLDGHRHLYRGEFGQPVRPDPILESVQQFQLFARALGHLCSFVAGACFRKRFHRGEHGRNDPADPQPSTFVRASLSQCQSFLR